MKMKAEVETCTRKKGIINKMPFSYYLLIKLQQELHLILYKYTIMSHKCSVNTHRIPRAIAVASLGQNVVETKMKQSFIFSLIRQITAGAPPVKPPQCHSHFMCVQQNRIINDRHFYYLQYVNVFSLITVQEKKCLSLLRSLDFKRQGSAPDS